MPDLSHHDVRTGKLLSACEQAERRVVVSISEILSALDGGISGRPPRIEELQVWMERAGFQCMDGAEALTEYAKALRELAEHWSKAPEHLTLDAA